MPGGLPKYGKIYKSGLIIASERKLEWTAKWDRPPGMIAISVEGFECRECVPQSKKDDLASPVYQLSHSPLSNFFMIK
jgi:hypothetical protein